MMRTAAERDACAGAARWLRVQVLLPLLSLLPILAALSQAPPGTAWPVLPAALLLLMTAQSVHLVLDAAAFARFTDGTLDPAQFDATLVRWRLAAPATGARSIAERIAGTHRIARRARSSAAISSILSFVLLFGWPHV